MQVIDNQFFTTYLQGIGKRYKKAKVKKGPIFLGKMSKITAMEAISFRLLSIAFACLWAHPSLAAVLVTYNFDDVTSASISTTQLDTGNRLVYNATYGSFDRSGFNAIHAIQLSGAVHGGEGDYAVMIYGNNIVTQKTGFAANDLNKTYYVSFDIGATVYSDAGQASQAGDNFRINLLRADNTLLRTVDVTPGAWTGTQTFTRSYFSYLGDGTGDVRLQLMSGNTLTRFAGAVDNMAFWDSTPVPEPSSGALLVIGMGALAALKRRRAV